MFAEIKAGHYIVSRQCLHATLAALVITAFQMIWKTHQLQLQLQLQLNCAANSPVLFHA